MNRRQFISAAAAATGTAMFARIPNVFAQNFELHFFVALLVAAGYACRSAHGFTC